MLLLLGIDWGQFSEQLPVLRNVKRGEPTSDVRTQLYEEYIERMSGMTCVILAWRIADLLEHVT
jgi:hypothetical protein